MQRNGLCQCSWRMKLRYLTEVWEEKPHRINRGIVTCYGRRCCASHCPVSQSWSPWVSSKSRHLGPWRLWCNSNGRSWGKNACHGVNKHGSANHRTFLYQYWYINRSRPRCFFSSLFQSLNYQIGRLNCVHHPAGLPLVRPASQLCGVAAGLWLELPGRLAATWVDRGVGEPLLGGFNMFFISLFIIGSLSFCWSYFLDCYIWYVFYFFCAFFFKIIFYLSIYIILFWDRMNKHEKTNNGMAKHMTTTLRWLTTTNKFLIDCTWRKGWVTPSEWIFHLGPNPLTSKVVALKIGMKAPGQCQQSQSMSLIRHPSPTNISLTIWNVNGLHSYKTQVPTIISHMSCSLLPRFFLQD